MEDIKKLALDKGIILKRKQGSKYIGTVIEGKFKGCECELTRNNILKDKNKTIKILTDEGKKMYFDTYAQSRGYKVLEYPKNLYTTSRCLLLSPQGNEWDVIWNSFENNKNLNCPKDNMKSIGERIIQTILKENNINFICEKSINTGLKRPQRLDFYIELEESKYAIEYMGEQHFKQATGSWSKPLKEIQELDEIKKMYCIENNIKLLYIEYPNEDKFNIFNKIQDFLNVELEYTNNIELFTKYKDNEKDIIEYYLNHTAQETSDKFNMSVGNIKGLMKRRGVQKRFKNVVGLNVKTLEEIRFNTLKEAQDYFLNLGLKSSGIRACVTGTRKTCCGYLWRYEDEDFSEKAKTITDKRIKVYVAKKGNEVIKLPLQMLFSEYGLPKANVVGCVKGKYKTVKGYTIREATKEEQEETLSSISYIDYIQSFK